jgi:hypothetical protein
MILNSEAHYFPTPDTPGFGRFATAFVRLMFAHAGLERQIRELQGVVTGDPKFGEQPNNQFRNARTRPQQMTALITEHLGSIPESSDITKCLGRAIPLCDKRNLLAHGVWWEFKRNPDTITVASPTEWSGEEANVCFTVDEIEAIAVGFDDLEAELWHLKRSIEHRHPAPDENAIIQTL